MFIAVFFFRIRVHAGKLGQVTNFTIVSGTAKHCVDQYTVLFRVGYMLDFVTHF